LAGAFFLIAFLTGDFLAGFLAGDFFFAGGIAGKGNGWVITKKRGLEEEATQQKKGWRSG
jgi:hypothetical protein